MLRETPRPIYLKDYRPPSFLIDRVELRFELDEQDARVHSRMEFRRNPAADPGDGALRLDGEQIELLAYALVSMMPSRARVSMLGVSISRAS